MKTAKTSGHGVIQTRLPPFSGVTCVLLKRALAATCLACLPITIYGSSSWQYCNFFSLVQHARTRLGRACKTEPAQVRLDDCLMIFQMQPSVLLALASSQHLTRHKFDELHPATEIYYKSSRKRALSPRVLLSFH